jgi:ABC-2 type transport system ATP-binding protein
MSASVDNADTNVPPPVAAPAQARGSDPGAADADPGLNANVDADPGPGAVPALQCTGLVYAFKQFRAVDEVDLLVEPGTVYGLLGPNGAGKTTAIRAITTLLPVPPRMVRVFGIDAARDPMAVRRLLGYVPQQLSADSALTGRENVAMFARLFDVPSKRRAARVASALDAVGLSDAADRMAGTYSGGMIRRLELAQALVSAPRLLILDEPTIGLDPIARASVWERIGEVRAATGMTVFVTTHYMDEADQYCDLISLMHRAKIRATGTPAELKASLGSPGATLEDVFRHYTGDTLDEPTREGFRDVRSTRRTAARLR